MNRPRLRLVLDWDGTITKRDTLHFLGRIGMRHHARYDPSAQQQVAATHEHEHKDTWAFIVDEYMNDFNHHVESYRPARTQRTTIEQERAWLGSLRDVERKSVQRVERLGLFRGVTAQEIQGVAHEAVHGGELSLRTGWTKLLLLSQLRDGRTSTEDEYSHTGFQGIKITIVSVNWSACFIRASMLSAAAAEDNPSLTANERTRLVQAIMDIDIHSNEIVGLSDANGSSGALDKPGEPGIRTSADKLGYLQAIMTPSQGSNEKPTIIYVGDSSTDLEALMSSDVGICIRDEPMGSGQRELAEVFDRVGIPVTHVSEESSNTSRIFWAQDLDEVVTMIKRLILTIIGSTTES